MCDLPGRQRHARFAEEWHLDSGLHHFRRVIPAPTIPNHSPRPVSMNALPYRTRCVGGIGPCRSTHAYQAGPLTRTPYIPVTYWSFRFMVGLGVFSAIGAGLVLFLTRRGRVPTRRWVGWLGILLPLAMVFGNSWGWLFTEMGRQPWVVFGLMTTAHGVSPGVSQAEAWISVVTLTLLYATLMVVELGLLLKYVRRGADPFEEPPEPTLRGPL